MPLFDNEYLRNSTTHTVTINLLIGIYTLLNGVISKDLERLREIFNDMKYRTVCLRQLSFLLSQSHSV